MTEAGAGSVAAELLTALEDRGWTVATAESLTGGLVAATLVDVPGASRSLRGGVVAYATDVKGSVLGVDAGLLAEHGAVHPEVARQLAERVRGVMGADVGLGTTGVAGPDPQDGRPPGTVHVAVATPAGTVVRTLALTGDRAAIRTATCAAVLREALVAVRGDHDGGAPGTRRDPGALGRS
ncbi:CinA family protein [Cellulomonas hominis]|uniref:CinA family protein n=1 Tax=Cellulomonas hominis TaxID=156981 RepID=UPI001B8E91C2|nr:CinA family protein [Cellulomonas hominis]VTR78120.1 Putative competence-damage inducible protein [Cellulomonas hominis]